ncbi:MAG: AAA family ATPase [bacterium]|nr:AAA family ATPase [bacterium]
MKKLLLFAGLPGVGKSTISRRVSEKTGAKIVDLDDFKKTDVDPALVTSQIDPPELRWGYYRKALEYVFSLFDRGTPAVIMDEVFHLSSLRTQLEALCAGQQVQVLWVEIRCPYDVVEKRLRSTRREGHILSTEEALKMHVLFMEIFEEFSSSSPNHVVVNNENGVSVDLLVENILKRS